MAQFVRPIADVDAGSWSTTPFWSKIDEDIGGGGDDVVVTSDAVGNNINTSDLDLEGTNSGITDPAVSTGHILRVLWNSSITRDMTGHFELWQGVPDTGSLIAEATVELVNATEVETASTLSAGEADAITDYNDLHFALWGRGTGGGPDRSLVVDACELEVPDNPNATANLTAITATVTLTATTQTASATANATAINVLATLTATTRTASATADLTERYLDKPGTTGHNANTPDTAALDITGDIWLAGRIALVDWTPNVIDNAVIGKWEAAGNQRSYRLEVEDNVNSNVLRLSWSDNGVDQSQHEKDSTVAPTVNNNETLWVAGTLDVSTGDVKFYTGGGAEIPVWVQLGTTITGSGATSIFNSTAVVEVGANNDGTSNFLIGKIHNGQIEDGYDVGVGTLVADFNAQDFNINDTDTDTAVDSTGKTWTINGVDSVIRGPLTIIATIPTVTVTADATANLTAIQAIVTLDTVAASGDSGDASANLTTINAVATLTGVDAQGNGSRTLTAINAAVTITTVATTTSNTATLTAVNAVVNIPTVTTTTSASFTLTAVNVVVTMPAVVASASGDATANLTSIAAVVSIDSLGGSASVVLTERSLRTNDTSGEYVQTPTHASLDIVGDLDVRWDGVSGDYDLSDGQILLGKWGNTGNNRSWIVSLTSAGGGSLLFGWRNAADSEHFVIINVTSVTTDGERIQFRCALDVDDDIDGAEVKLYHRNDGDLLAHTGWTQIGATHSHGEVSDIKVGTEPLEVAAHTEGTVDQLLGRTIRAVVFDGIGAAGTLVGDFRAANFEDNDSDTDTAVDSTGKTWTINGTAAVIHGLNPVPASIPTVTTTTSATAVLTAIAATVNLDAPTTTTSATLTAAAVNVVVTMPAVVASSTGDATANLTTINAVVTITATTQTASADATPTAINAVVTLDQPTTTTSATVNATAVNVLVTLDAPTTTADATANLTVILAVVTLTGVDAQGNGSRTLTAINALVTLDQPTTTTTATANPTAVNVVVTLTATTQTASATANASAVNVVVTMPAVVASATGDATANLTTINAVVALTTVDAQGNGTRTLTAINAIVTLDTAATTASATANPAAITAIVTLTTVTTTTSNTASLIAVNAVVTLDAPATTTSASITATAVNVVVTLPAVAATAAGDATANLTSIAAVVALTTVDAQGNGTRTLTAINALVTLDTVTTTIGAAPNLAAIAAVVTIDQPTTTTSASLTLTAVNAVVTLTGVDAQGNGTRNLTAINAVVTLDQPATTTSNTATLTAINAVVTILATTVTSTGTFFWIDDPVAQTTDTVVFTDDKVGHTKLEPSVPNPL